MIKMNPVELDAFLQTVFPQVDEYHFHTEHVAEKFLQMRMRYHEQHLRPGGTISGPAMMTLADTAMYLLVIAHIGPVPLAVTTNLNINFLRKPAQKDVVAEAKLLKLGARLAVGEVTIFSEGEGDPVAHATLTYSIPPR